MHHLRDMTNSETRTTELKTLDKADQLFLTDGLARGMSISELAGFLNRSEDEIRSYLTSSSSSGFSRARVSQRCSTAKRSTFTSGSDVSLANRRASAARL
jgi:hypothetical protein